MTHTTRQRGLAAVSLAVLVAFAAPIAPARAEGTRDTVLATIGESIKAVGAKEVTWGAVTGTDAEFTVAGFKSVIEEEDKEAVITTEAVVYTGAKPSADGGYTADAIAVKSFKMESDAVTITAAAMKITGYVGQPPEKIRAKTTTGERFDRIEATDISVTDESEKTVPIASVVVTASDYVAGVPRRAAFDMKGLVVPVDAKDDSMKDLAELGYAKISLDVGFAGTWDDKTGRVVVDQMTIGGADMGSLKIAFAMGGFTPEVMKAMKEAEADQAKQMELLQGLSVERLSLRWDDASLTKRVIDMQAKRQGVPSDAYVQQLNALTPMLLSSLGNKDFEKKVAGAAGAFLKAPKSLTISAAPGKPMSVSEIMGAAMMSPQSLPKVLGADVKAND